MVKKVISFIVILLAYCIIGVSVVIATSNFGLGFNDSANAGGFSYAYALDRAGDIYYVKYSGDTRSLVSLDSSGKSLFEKKLSAEVFGENFYIGSIYVEHDKTIYLSSYEYDPDTMFITRASVHMFLEDGTYSQRVFSQEVSGYPNVYGSLISSFSEDDASVYFAVRTGKVCEIFCALKNNSEPVVKVCEYTLDSEEVYGLYASASKELYVGGKNGITVYTHDATRQIAGSAGTVFSKFWNGISSVYTIDSVTGDIYVISNDYRLSNILNGTKIINAEADLSTKDFSDIAVGITGNILGAVRGDTEGLYSGSISLMSRVYTNHFDESSFLISVLSIAAVSAAVILLSILTWDFYCSILKMRLSILLRQSLLIAMLIFVALYSLSFLVIIPQVERIVETNYRHETQLIANSFISSINGAINGSEQAVSYEGYNKFLYDYGTEIASAKPDGSFIGDCEKPEISLIERRGDRLVIVASGEMYPEGTPADVLMYDKNLTEIIAGMTGEETFPLSESINGDKLFLIRKISLQMSANDAYIVVAARVSGLATAVEQIQNLINLFLVIGGVALVAIFMIIENITAGAARKLKRSVDKIAAGQYDTGLNINTGDEMEELAISVQALSNHIVDKTTSLERLNNSYYRFVPLSFLKTLGETKIELVSKSLHTKRVMTVLFLRFEFSQPLANMEAQDIFESINAVFEQVIPIINSHEGTAYNFLFNGFNAIFSEQPEQALQAAIKVREVVNAFNEVQRVQNKRTVDVRIVISRGEVLLGFIGDEKRMEPTAVATAITQCEEIEGLCSESGMYVVCSDDAYDHLPKGKYRTRCIGRFRTSEGDYHKLYDMFDSDPYSLVKLKEQLMTKFELGVALFEKRDFVNARKVFMDIVKYAADDGVSRNYMYLSEHNISSEVKQLTYTVYNNHGE